MDLNNMNVRVQTKLTAQTVQHILVNIIKSFYVP